LAKIAVKLEQALRLRAAHGYAGEAKPHIVAQGDGWTVADVVCTSGPQDHPFEEQLSNHTIALVTAGSFQYRGGSGCELMLPGSFVLGNAGQYFECGHEHGFGDRCLAFWYTQEYFERLAADAGARSTNFSALRLPPLRDISGISARAEAALARAEAAASLTTKESSTAWEEISAELAGKVIGLSNQISPKQSCATPSVLARVTRALRAIESNPDGSLGLTALARRAGLSPYHFLRIFKQLTGLTPHQYILRCRLRESAARVAHERARIVDIALDSGFGDVSNFNRAFHAEFGVSPRAFRSKL
jgi:AraC family transcriptional regulator